MLSMEHIQSFFPPQLRGLKRNILREYLQYKILEMIFATGAGRKLVFLGGTAIHIVHGNPRFSEDLDFDTQELSMDALGNMAERIQQGLSREGYEIELSVSTHGAFRANIRFVGLVQSMGISGHREEKLLIHVDAEPQNFDYQPEQVIISKFDVFCRINVVPIALLLSQKIACILQRPRPIGRDFYDTLFLWGKTSPDFTYLTQKTGIENEAHLLTKLEARCNEVDFERLSKDLEPFVANQSESRKVALFRDFIADLQKR
jgi:predicted nucleotidyltransferase component of viral defense system